MNPKSFRVDKMQIIDTVNGYEIWFDGQMNSDEDKPLTIEENGISYPIASNSTLLIRDTTEVYIFDKEINNWRKLGGN